ncbi:efflux RND transporter periplasmic adaptor subunit [Paenibacillus lignilyticus]|uniref:Efflux RND transporter periplasmic adaptor subunit n=1 Tax=Paenibacillus lignilyticus TaxID=1172615 RepID=A0ABS5C830_9BACL|nr:efflux RND transporter periplasmic adaptor subunit [Paenibacillus lignilyticus]MBP3961610.1 efflux RND transporter periplasmic adaptor subunit [Paenibacillus lignilyticus]MBP3963720.1 efflux RND transporter periplasmic adaptor subunit [Paenibacillus lignilyticus]
MEDEKLRSRKRGIRLVAGLFLVVLVGLTLAGNTLQALSLTKVYTIEASKGQLSHSYEGTATVVPYDERGIANPAGWTVTRVHVKKDQAVHKGQTLVEYDDTEAKQQIAAGQSVLKKLEMSIEGLQHNFIQASSSEDPSAKLAAKLAIETAKLDIADQKLAIEQLQASAAANSRITAPFDGIVTDIHAEVGLKGDGAPDIRISNAAKGYRFELPVPSDVGELLQVGEKLDVLKLGKESAVLTGNVAEIKGTVQSEGDESGGMPTNSIVFSVQEKSLRGGERVQVVITKDNPNSEMLVPKAAVHEDSGGVYIYTFEEKQGPLGNAYYVARIPIEVMDENDTTAAIRGGIFEQQSIILDSDHLIMEGERVRL